MKKKCISLLVILASTLLANEL